MRKYTTTKILLLITSLLISFVYIYFQSVSIYGGDGGELVTAMVMRGIPHPPGFPLYSFLGSLLVKYVTFSTPAWSASLLSSIPSIVAKIFFFLLLYKLTKNKFLSFTGTLLYAFLYPVWLFSEVPEVISLLNLGIVICLYLSVSYYQKKDIRKLYLLVLIFSLTLFHNYIVLLIAPGVIYLLAKKGVWNIVKKRKISTVLLLLAGSIPYIYFFIISRNYPPLDYDHPATLVNLLKLMTRSSYGTFQAASGIYFNPIVGLNSIVQLFVFTLRDIKIIGIILVLFGLLNLRNKDKNLFIFFLINIFFSIFFFFYASFPLVLEYHLGTFEKFLSIPYLFFTIAIVYGLEFVLAQLPHFFRNLFFGKIVYWGIVIFALLFVGIIFVNSYQKISILKYDLTAEYLGIDLLESIPKGGIVAFNTDTTLYNAFYAHYVMNIRPDVKIIRYEFLQLPYYREYVKKAYPNVFLPKENKDVIKYLKEFLDENSKKYALLYSEPLDSIPNTWLPAGLLWRYYSKGSQLPSEKGLIAQNLALWQKFHAPYSGSLRIKRNLLLADVLRAYGRGHESLGLTFYQAQQYLYAAEEFKQLINYSPYSPNGYIDLAKVLMKLGKCDEAKKNLDNSLDIDNKNLQTYKYMIDLYANCYRDSKEADKYAKIYASLSVEQEK